MTAYITAGTTTTTTPNRITIGDAAKMLGVHADTVRHYVKDGRLRATRFGRGSSHYRLDPADVAAFLAAHTSGGDVL